MSNADLIEAMVKDVWRQGELAHAVPLSARKASEIRQALMTMLNDVVRSDAGPNVVPFERPTHPREPSPSRGPDQPLRNVRRQ